MSYSWYKNGREIVKSWDIKRKSLSNADITQEYFDDYVSNQKHYDGMLNLYDSEITSLGKLESVEGSLRLDNPKMITLGNLKHVSGHLGLVNLDLTDLGKLESVGGFIYCATNSSTYDLLMDSKFSDQVTITRRIGQTN